MDLQKLREQIDNIDDSILELFKMRLNMVGMVAEYKKQNNLPILNAEREREILERICSECDVAVKGYAERLFNTIMELSRTYQEGLIR